MPDNKATEGTLLEAQPQKWGYICRPIDTDGTFVTGSHDKAYSDDVYWEAGDWELIDTLGKHGWEMLPPFVWGGNLFAFFKRPLQEPQEVGQ